MQFLKYYFFITALLLFTACISPEVISYNDSILTDNFYKKGYRTCTNGYSHHAKSVELDTMVMQFIHQWQIEGASLCLLKDGELLYAKGYGWADKEERIEMQAYHRMRIASVSKLFTAVGIMKLIEEGKLSLDSKVFGKKGVLKSYKHLPIADTLAYKITIEHLLTHTGGWRNQLRTDPMFAPVAVAKAMNLNSSPNFETTLRFMLAQRGMFTPGSLADYSNFGYTLLGEIIKDVTGKNYEAYMTQNILAPMNVTQMAIGKNRYIDRLPYETRYYAHAKEALKPSIYNFKDSALAVYEGNDTYSLGGAGGWIASPMDIAKFVLHIDGLRPVPDILQQKTLERMTTTLGKDSTKQMLIGWRHADAEKWWRTGNLSSTSSSVTRRHDGYVWVFLTNTGSWRGPFFVYEIEGLMKRFLQKMKTP